MANVVKPDSSLDVSKSIEKPICSNDASENNPSPPAEIKYQQPPIVFNGCTFTGCAVALSGPSTSYFKGKEEVNVAETLEGITYNDIFDELTPLLCTGKLILIF